MTDPNRTHIYFLLDRSGSMESIKSDTVGGFAAFIAEQCQTPGEHGCAPGHGDRDRVRHLPVPGDGRRPRRQPDGSGAQRGLSGAGRHGVRAGPGRHARCRGRRAGQLVGLRRRGAAARRARFRDGARRRAPLPADRRVGGEDDPTLANVVLTNGARLYVDHAHPEYSSPEVTTPRDGAVWDRAGELVMREAVAGWPPQPARGQPLQEQHRRQGRLLRHARELPDAPGDPFADIVRHLTPVLRRRQVMCGSGRVGIGVDSATPATRSPSAATSSRSRSAWRRP
jgi:hypothetical protein